METNKIYARANENGIVIRFFSEAFEQPQSTDILIDATNTDRHGANVYQVYDEEGIPNYKIANGALAERDKSADIQRMASAQRIAELKQLLQETDYMAIKFAESAISAEEYELTKLSRAQWRNEINALETTM